MNEKKGMHGRWCHNMHLIGDAVISDQIDEEVSRHLNVLPNRVALATFGKSFFLKRSVLVRIRTV